MKDDCDSITLPKAIREITFNFKSQCYQPLQVHKLNSKMATMKQRSLTNS